MLINQICCSDMRDILEDYRSYIHYEARYREYYVETKDSLVIYVIEYCPWCAKKLPDNLTDKWFEVLEKEYGLDDPDSKEQKLLIPKEFETDEWWKKRDL